LRKFAFPLQKALDHAVHVERTRQRDLAQARRRLAEADRALMQRVGDWQDALRASGQASGRLDLARVRASWAYAGALRQQVEALKRTVESLAAAVREKQAELLAASKRRTLLERLREQRLAEHAELVAREEQAAQDESARTPQPGAV
jgi:flagellar export protein FliJ